MTTVDENTQFVVAQVKQEPLKCIQSLISYVPTSTIELTHSEEEDERVSLVPVTLEVGNGNDLLNSTNGSNDKSSSPPLQSQLSSQSGPSPYVVRISSIIALSSLSTGSTVTPFMTQLYQNVTCLPESITPISVDMPIPSSIVPPVFKIPLHIPSLSSVSFPMSEKTPVVSPSTLKTTTLQGSSTETSILDISSTPEVILA